MLRSRKHEMVEHFRTEFAAAKSLILTSYQGIDVNTINELRAEFRKNGVEFHVVKNTLARLAIKGTDIEEITDLFSGPVAVAYSHEDAVSPATVIRKFAKDNKKFEVRGGWLDGTRLDEAAINKLADMPTKPELQAKVLMLFNAVPTKFVRTLNAAPQQFVQVLNARKESLAS